MSYKDLYDEDGNLIMTGKERTAQWHMDNRESQAQYREANRERRAQYDIQRYAENRESTLQRSAQYYEDNRESILQKRVQYREELRDWAFRWLGGKCVCCGCTDQDTLVVDHINGGGSAEKRTIGSTGVYKNIINHINPSLKYQLLCACCNTIKAYQQNEKEHNSQDKYRILAKELHMEVLYHLGMYCGECGYNNDMRALQIDHINNNGREQREAIGRNGYKYYLYVLNHLGEGYQALCASCHLKRHRHER